MNYLMDQPGEGNRVEEKTSRQLTLEQIHWAGIRPNMRVLDLGCAAGTTCRLMGEIVGADGKVVGIDGSHHRLTEASRHTNHSAIIEYRHGEATAMPARDCEFDISWSRFLFEYLPDPAAVLREMIRVTRPGGTVFVSDLDGNCIWHYPPTLRREIEAALETFGSAFNPRVGLSLFTLFADSGLEDISVDVRPYHVIGGAVDESTRQLWAMKLSGVAKALVARGWPTARADGLRDAFDEHLRDRRSFLYSVLLSVRGTTG